MMGRYHPWIRCLIQESVDLRGRGAVSRRKNKSAADNYGQEGYYVVLSVKLTLHRY